MFPTEEMRFVVIAIDEIYQKLNSLSPLPTNIFLEIDSNSPK